MTFELLHEEFVQRRKVDKDFAEIYEEDQFDEWLVDHSITD